MHILNIAFDIIKTLLIIDLLVFIHELGHYLAARKSGITVLRFALGFGPKLVGFKRGETEYCLLAIPFGGYVKMAGENPAEELPEETPVNTEGFYTSASVSKRALVAISGPGMNIIFAFVAISLAYMVGLSPRPGTEIGYVEPNSPAARAGLIPGDKIISMDGYKTKNWDDIRENVGVNPNKNVEVVLLRNGTDSITTHVIPELAEKTELGKIGVSPPMAPIVGQVEPGSEAESIGFKTNDVIIAVNNRPISHAIELINEIEKTKDKQKYLDITLTRDGSTIDLKFKLDLDESGQIKTLNGLAFGKLIRLNPIAALGAAIPETVQTGGKIFQFLKKLIVRDVSAKYVAGPVGIVQITMSAVKTGIAGILWFAGFLSINLGVINLLPLFITDGWVLIMLLIEKIRGKALSIQRQVLIQQVGIGFFILLFVLVTYNDILRLVTNSF
jgi:regulator of sigma E protease